MKFMYTDLATGFEAVITAHVFIQRWPQRVAMHVWFDSFFLQQLMFLTRPGSDPNLVDPQSKSEGSGWSQPVQKSTAVHNSNYYVILFLYMSYSQLLPFDKSHFKLN